MILPVMVPSESHRSAQLILSIVVGTCAVAACGTDDPGLACGPGTVEADGLCVPVSTGGEGGGAGSAVGGGGGTSGAGGSVGAQGGTSAGGSSGGSAGSASSGGVGGSSGSAGSASGGAGGNTGGAGGSGGAPPTSSQGWFTYRYLDNNNNSTNYAVNTNNLPTVHAQELGLGGTPEWSPDGQHIMSVGYVVHVTPDAISVPVPALPNPGFQGGLAWAPDSKHALSWQEFGPLTIADVTVQIPVPVQIATDIYRAVWSPTDLRIAYVTSPGSGYEIYVDTIAANAVVKHVKVGTIPSNTSISFVRWSHDGSRFAVGDRVFDADASDESAMQILPHTGAVFLSPDGDYAVQSNAGELNRYDLRSGSPVLLSQLATSTAGFSVSPAGGFLTYTKADGSYLYSFASDSSGKIEAEGQALSNLLFAQDDSVLIADSSSGSAYRFTGHLQNATRLYDLPSGASETIRSLAPDGNFLAYFQADSTTSTYNTYVVDVGVDPPGAAVPVSSYYYVVFAHRSDRVATFQRGGGTFYPYRNLRVAAKFGSSLSAPISLPTPTGSWGNPTSVRINWQP